MLHDQCAVAQLGGQHRQQLGEGARAAGRAGDDHGPAGTRRRSLDGARRRGIDRPQVPRRRAARPPSPSRSARRRSGRLDRLTTGFTTSSTAPSASASTARAPCAGENDETTITGIGEAASRRVAQHADAVQAGHLEVERQHVRPQAAGRRRAPRRRSPPSRRRRRRLAARVSESSLRMNAESSATTARIGCVVSGVGCDTAMRGRGCPREAGAAARRSPSGRLRTGRRCSRSTARRSPILAIASTWSDAAAGRGLELRVLDRQHLLDVVDDHAGGAGIRLDDHDLGGVGPVDHQAEPLGQVAHRHDPPAQVDHAADPRGRRGDAPWFGCSG